MYSYKIFEEIKKIVQEAKWYDIFDNAAQGIFRDGFSFSDNTLYYKRGRTKTSTPLPDDPVEALEVCKTFIGRKGLNTTKRNQRWGNVKRGKIRALYLQRYEEKLLYKHNLTKHEIAQLRHELYLNCLAEIIDSKSVIFLDGDIVNISNLIWNNEIRQFYVVDNSSYNVKRGSVLSRSS